MLVDLLNDALVVHGGGLVVPQQRVLATLLGVVTDLGQIHGEEQLDGCGTHTEVQVLPRAP